MKIYYIIFLLLPLLFISCSQSPQKEDPHYYEDARPYIRWWWFANEYEKEDIIRELDWIKAQGFGGVELSFIYPLKRDPNEKRFAWLGPEWQEAITFAKSYTDSLGLGCDFTFGTLWPFGGTFVSDADRTKVFGEPDFKQPLHLSWTHPDTGNVLDHLNRGAFDRYAKVMGEALEPALEEGMTSALFCDSWEVETKNIWTKGFDSLFLEKFGYDITPFMDSIYKPGFEGQRYDYMKLVSELVIQNFYIPFTEKAHQLGAFSRVQCAGSPTDLIKAYSMVDVPETEVMLYNPSFSRIVASSAALAGKTIVSSETFTCLYGWPREHIMEEKISDLKLVADACFANGVNQIIWHGKPFSFTENDDSRFYATVHVGKEGSLSPHLKNFNSYLSNVSKLMRAGRTYTDIAVYLPIEDSWIAGELPKDLQLPWAWGEYELRYQEFPEELNGYHPLWINYDFLENGIIRDGKLHVGESVFDVLYVDVDYLEKNALEVILKLAGEGLKVVRKNEPKQAGFKGDESFENMLKKLKALENVYTEMKQADLPPPLLQAKSLPDYWIRQTKDGLLIFLANPLASDLKYPLEYGFSEMQNDSIVDLRFNYKNRVTQLNLQFKAVDAKLVHLNNEGKIQSVKNLNFVISK